MDWLDDFWRWVDASPSRVEIMGGLIVALVVSVTALMATLLKRSWREKIWGTMANFFRWLWSWHPVSARRHTRDMAATTQAVATLLENTRLEDQRAKEFEQWREDLKKELEERFRRRTAQAVTSDRPPTRPPLPLPRWSVYIDPDGDGKDYVLRNAVARSVAKEVRIESDGDLTILDGGNWEDLSGEALGSFRGELHPRGFLQGVQFEVEWYDESGEHRDGYVKLAPKALTGRPPEDADDQSSREG